MTLEGLCAVVLVSVITWTLILTPLLLLLGQVVWVGLAGFVLAALAAGLLRGWFEFRNR